MKNGDKMGADLTINKSGRYFWDSYNPSNIWWVIRMSYGNISEKLRRKKLLDDEGELTKEGVKFVWEEVKKHPLTEKKALSFIARNRESFGLSTHNYTPDNIIKAVKEIQKHDKKMRGFWQEAVNLKSTVEWSV